MKIVRNIRLKVKEQEEKLSLTPETVIKESCVMVELINRHLKELKDYVLSKGFEDKQEEIEFFRDVKPMLFAKLLFYNKLYQIETGRPVDLDKASRKYFKNHLAILEEGYNNSISVTEFYRYYRSGRRDLDEQYFTRGHIYWKQGFDNWVFEMDVRFSTYYDHELARIIACDLLYEYLNFRLENLDYRPDQGGIKPGTSTKIPWTESKNALIELIYALHISQSVGHGKSGIRQIAALFQSVFDVQFGDIHHAFHRMKYRTGPSYLDRLKKSLDTYISEQL